MKIIGDVYPIQRLRTGLWSFDRAFRKAPTKDQPVPEWGFPLNSGMEIYGYRKTGKSTVAFSLAGIIARILNGDVSVYDLEGYDPTQMKDILQAQGFDNTLYYISEEYDEEGLDKMIEIMIEKNPVVSVLDSVGAISPVGEVDGSTGEVNMGRRGMLLAKFYRKYMKAKRGKVRTLFSTNHMLPSLGSYGVSTPGGTVKDFLNAMQIQISKNEKFEEGTFVLQGKVKFNRFGQEGRNFLTATLPGTGIHVGLTYVFECLSLKLVTKSKGWIKQGATNHGRLTDLVEKAKMGEDVFQPFKELLEVRENQEKEMDAEIADEEERKRNETEDED